MDFLLAYLYLIFIDFKCNGQVNVIQDSIEIWHYSSDFRKIFLK